MAVHQCTVSAAIGVWTMRNVTTGLPGSAPNELALSGHSQESMSDQLAKDRLAGLPIHRPQALRLSQRQTEAWHLGVLGSHPTREVVFRVGRVVFEKSLRHWHDNSSVLAPIWHGQGTPRATRTAG